MAISVKIDFNNAYSFDSISEDMRTNIFQTELQEGNRVSIGVRISEEPHELLPNVYNLAFGPLTQKGRIDDKVQLNHKDYSKTFSTILLAGLSYMNSHKDHYLGVDGSTNSRAYLYYTFLQRNYEYLDQRFNIYGLKYYVRITRFGKTQYSNPFDFEDIQLYPDKIEKGSKIDPYFMYNYFIFNLKS